MIAGGAIVMEMNKISRISCFFRIIGPIYSTVSLGYQLERATCRSAIK